MNMHDYQHVSVHVHGSGHGPRHGPRKSVALSLLLTFLFGPFGLFYASVAGGFIMLGVWFFSILLAVFTLGFSLIVTVPLLFLMQMVWAGVAVDNR